MNEMIKKRRDKLALKEGYIGLLLRIVLLASIGVLLFTQVFLIARVKGNEMFPAVKDGDLVLAFRLQQNYEKNDLISYKLDGRRRIGRVIAQENDLVNMDDDGKLLVNAAIQSGEIMYPSYPRDTLEYPYEVPEDHVFILGDYRTQAKDSRDFGSIPKKEIEGKVITILRRRGL